MKLFEHKEEVEYYKPVKVGNLRNNNYIEHKDNGDGSKFSSIEKYLNEIRPYLKDNINNLETSMEGWDFMFDCVHLLCSFIVLQMP